MKFCKRLMAAGLVGLSTLSVSGCGSYYMVRDPSTSGTYFTKDVDDEGYAGAVRFKDEVSGSVVTLPTSEVTKISREEFGRKVKGRADW
jgi:hypothetical protein